MTTLNNPLKFTTSNLAFYLELDIDDVNRCLAAMSKGFLSILPTLSYSNDLVIDRERIIKYAKSASYKSYRTSCDKEGVVPIDVIYYNESFINIIAILPCQPYGLKVKMPILTSFILASEITKEKVQQNARNTIDYIHTLNENSVNSLDTVFSTTSKFLDFSNASSILAIGDFLKVQPMLIKMSISPTALVGLSKSWMLVANGIASATGTSIKSFASFEEFFKTSSS